MYDLYIDGKLVGMGLSEGELNQWILDLDRELDGLYRRKFRNSFGLGKQVDFEMFLYKMKIETPLSVEFGLKVIDIVNSEL